MNYKMMVACLAAVLSLAAPGTGAAQNGIVEYDFPLTVTDYVDCLGEDVEFNVTVTIREHYINTPNGGFHYVQNWFIEGTAVGLSSGWTWFGHAAGPGTGNFTGAQLKDGYNLEAMYSPLDGGRKFRRWERVRVVKDANGVTRVENFEPTQFRCLGR